MVQPKQLLAPAVLFAAGSFAGTANAAVFVESVDAPASSQTLIAIGVPTSDAQFAFIQPSIKGSPLPFSFLGSSGTAGVSFEGDLTTAPYIPDDTTAFEPSVKVAPMSGYYGLRFDVGGDTYYGYATADTPFHISQIAFDAPSEFAVNVSVAVPEPATWAEMLLGLGVAGAAMRRRRQHAAALSA